MMVLAMGMFFFTFWWLFRRAIKHSWDKQDAPDIYRHIGSAVGKTTIILLLLVLALLVVQAFRPVSQWTNSFFRDQVFPIINLDTRMSRRMEPIELWVVFFAAPLLGAFFGMLAGGLAACKGFKATGPAKITYLLHDLIPSRKTKSN